MQQATKETFVELNGVSTKVTTIGKTIGSEFDVGEKLVLIIPGNPGVNSFYDKFAKRINEKLKCSVWCVGHAGHNVPPILNQGPVDESLFGLKGQVQNKVDFITKYIPEDVNVHLVGHSIGSYMVLELLDDPNISKKIKHAYLLFPTIEQMASSNNGKILTNYVKNIVWLTVFLSSIFVILPRFLQTALIHGYMFIVGMPTDNCESIRQLVKPSILQNVFSLAFEELDKVLERNNHSIESNLKKIKLFYGKSDGWTPFSYYNNIQKDFKGIDAEITSINHAFVLKSSLEVGDIVSEWIMKIK